VRYAARLVLLALLSLSSAAADSAPASEPRTVAVTARRYEFEPATITLKKGETVKLVVTSEDVTHGLFLRPLHVDMDLPAGEARTVVVTPAESGTYTAICHHFCGAGHGGMKLKVIVE